MKGSFGDRAFGFWNAFMLALTSVVCVYPLYYVLMASFSEPTRLLGHSGMLITPLGFTFGGYKLVFQHPLILLSYRNTLFYVVSITLLSLLMNATGGYVISRKNLKLRKIIMKFLVITMFVNGGLIPTYLLITWLGLLRSPLSLVIPSAYSVWNMIIMRSAYAGIPDELEESARIDGAGDLRILFQILLPLAKATLAVLALMTAVGVWNNWFSPMIYLANNTDAYPLALVLRQLLILNDIDLSADVAHQISQLNVEMYKRLVQYAVIVVSTAPILCIYPFLQRYFVKGVMLGSLKG